jgi:hypothetical protein
MKFEPAPEINYPPLHPEKKPYDPSTSVYWQYYTEDERQVVLNHDTQDTSKEIALMRITIADVLKAQQQHPVTTPEESISILYAVSAATRTIGTLVKNNREYRKTHNKWDELYKEAMHIARIRTGVYRQVAALGFSVPDGVLEIEPDLMPKPLTYSESVAAKARKLAARNSPPPSEDGQAEDLTGNSQPPTVN